MLQPLRSQLFLQPFDGDCLVRGGLRETYVTSIAPAMCTTSEHFQYGGQHGEKKLVRFPCFKGNVSFPLASCEANI